MQLERLAYRCSTCIDYGYGKSTAAEYVLAYYD